VRPLAICFTLVGLLFSTPSSADPREDFDKCVDSYLKKSIEAKPSLVEFTTTLDKLCNSEAMKQKDNGDFPSTGNAALDSISANTKQKLQQLSDRYADDSKGSAVAYYSKLQEFWRKSAR